MDGRKRPAPWSRGSSPPTQRRRQSEQSTITDRRNSSRDVLPGHDRSQNGAGSASSQKTSTDHSPMHVMSPMSNGSGSNTPVQVVPTVPSMLSVAQKQMTSQSAPMDTLSALRLLKSSSVTNAPQTTNGTATTEVKVLKVQLRVAQIEDAKLRSHAKQLEDQIKQLETLPAQLAALKDLVEQRERAAAKGPSSDEISRRLGALENAEPAVKTAQFTQLQADVQAMKMDIKKLDPLPEQLKQLQSTATQNGKDIAEALGKSSKLRTDVDDLGTLKEDIKAVKEQRLAMRGDAVKIMIQTAIQPEIKKMDVFCTENEKTLKGLSTTVEANQKICDTLNQCDLPGQLQSLQDKINQVESNNNKTYEKVTTLDIRVTTFEENLTKLRKDSKNLYQDIDKYIGPIQKAHLNTDETVLQRVGYLEDKIRSLRKEQDYLSSEHDKLSTKSDEHPVDPKDFKGLQDIVCSLLKDSEKLAQDVKQMKPLTDQPQQHTSQDKNVQEGHTSLSEEHAKLMERVRKLEAAPARSASPAPSMGHSQLKKAVEGLENRVSDLDTAFKRVEKNQQDQKVITSQVKNFQSESSKLSNAQRSLQNEHDTIVDQIKTFESKQARLSEEHKTIVEQLKAYHGEQESLANQQKAFQTEQTKSSNEQKRFSKALESLDNRVTASEKTATQVKLLASEQAKFLSEQNKVSDRVTKLETAPKPAVSPNQTVGNNYVDLTPISSEVEDVQQRLRSMEDRVGGATGLSTIIDGLQDDVERMEADIHAFKNDLGVVQNSFTNIFAESFDPFKTSVEEQMKTHSQSFSQHSELLGKLQEQVAKSQIECPSHNFSAPQMRLLNNMVQSTTEVRQDLSCLQDSVKTEVEQRTAAVEDIRQQVVLKQDIISATQAIDTVKAAIRNLQSQYDNISTDDLHQKMVHWFVQHYPSTPANMLQQFAVIQHEVGQLRNFTDQINRIPNGTQALNALAQISPQLTALVQSPPGSKGSPELLAKTSEALKTINDSMAKAHKQIENLTRTVGSLQTSIHTLNSNNTPFVRTESLAALEQSISTLRADVEAEFKRALQARNEFVTKAGKEHDLRVDVEKSIRASIKDLTTKVHKEREERVEAEQDIVLASNDRFKELETGKIKTTSDQVESLQAALGKICTEFEKLVKEFNDPVNKELLNHLPTLFLQTGQLQWVIEDLNQNLPKGALEFEWSCDFKNKFNIPAPYSEESGEAAGKGKSKQ
ncbi:hypothetical protein BU25DRAFT_486398 [Macroventuria anomochaeta]|uniref:Uncharacterized protein n=1 Tax=Macroventuria anomochaeta TaxID=301207 RepID=A0ACB6SIM6_9PLEO|nr:uncharacterized protein BU25DRAFT_486398 [Macroventuria anomochaeta]KAF2633248.1 hypothetical protein BU25DRAFT_486398 [Macroventuria anomochaeta]